jgi:hypothetical protein
MRTDMAVFFLMAVFVPPLLFLAFYGLTHLKN